MKVQHAIDMLNKYYNPTDELIIDWVDMEQFNGDDEMTLKIWEDTLDLVERGDSVIDMQWVEHCVYTAQEEAK